MIVKILLTLILGLSATHGSLNPDAALTTEYKQQLLQSLKHDTLLQLLTKVFVSPTPVAKADDAQSKANTKLFLTPLIEKGDLKNARKAARVNLNSLSYTGKSYSGYLTVNKEYNSNLFFWYLPAQTPKTPWIIWFQGGPGASSLYGLFEEMGPFYVDGSSHDLEARKFAWTREYSMIFIDSPVGTGFSFTDDDRGYSTNQSQVTTNLYNALKQILVLFPNLKTAPLYLAGQSYAGKHVPSLAYEIYKNKDKADGNIKLQGLILGNPFIDPYTLLNYSPMMKQTGLLGEGYANFVKDIETQAKESIDKGEWVDAFNQYNDILNVFIEGSHLKNVYNYLDDNISLNGTFTEFIQTTEFKNAVHVGNTNYSTFGKVYDKLIPDFMKSEKSTLEALIPNYKVLSYSGQLDIIVAYGALENTYADLQLYGSKQYRTTRRQPWYHNNELAGLYKQIGNFTEVMVRNAGHMAPINQPSRVYGLISAFIKDLPLTEDTGKLSGTADVNMLNQELQTSFDLDDY